MYARIHIHTYTYMHTYTHTAPATGGGGFVPGSLLQHIHIMVDVAANLCMYVHMYVHIISVHIM